MERRKWLTWAVGQEVADKIYDNIEHSEYPSDRQCYFISGSFCWCTTKEGHDYWRDVHSKIQEYLATKIDPQLASFLKEKGLWDEFIDNFNPPCKRDSYDLGDSFLWLDTVEGYDFWGAIADDYCRYRSNGTLSITNLSLTNKSDYEDQLQRKETPRREGDQSGRGGIRCEGDESGFRLSYTQHRKRIDFQKREVRDFEVHLSPRHPILL